MVAPSRGGFWLSAEVPARRTQKADRSSGVMRVEQAGCVVRPAVGVRGNLGGAGFFIAGARRVGPELDDLAHSCARLEKPRVLDRLRTS